MEKTDFLNKVVYKRYGKIDGYVRFEFDISHARDIP